MNEDNLIDGVVEIPRCRPAEVVHLGSEGALPDDLQPQRARVRLVAFTNSEQRSAHRADEVSREGEVVSVCAEDPVQPIEETMSFAELSVITMKMTNMRLSTVNCLVPATERMYSFTFVMEYSKFSLIDVHQADALDWAKMCGKHLVSFGQAGNVRPQAGSF